MKVAIFETEHFEAAYPLVRLFDNGHHKITIFSYPYAQRQLAYMLHQDSERYQWVTKREDQSRISFIRTIYKEIKEKKIELLYLNTISDNFPFYAWLVRSLPGVRVIMTVHAINSFFTTRNKFLPRKMIAAWGKRRLRNAVNEYNVLSLSMIPALRQRLSANKKIHGIPGAVYEKNITDQARRSLHNPVKIVVPGSIDDRRRDYDHVFELLDLLKKENIPVLITLLGAFYSDYGQQVLNRCREWRQGEQQLVYYEKEWVDQPEFDRVMQEADLVFTPAAVHTMIDKGVEETYGLTISSGNVSDVIRYAKPFVIPHSLVIDPALEKSVLRYSQVKDILDFILLTHEDTWIYSNLQQAALEASKEYTVKRIREKNTEVF